MTAPTPVSPPLATDLITAYRACNPEAPVPAGHRYYTDLNGPAVRGAVPVMQRLFDGIVLAADPDSEEGEFAEDAFPKLLLTGHRGCGKTTELYELTDRLEQEGFVVVRFSAQQTLQPTEVGWQELLLEIAHQVFEQGKAGARRNGCTPSPKLHAEVYRVLDETVLKEIETRSAELKGSAEAEVSGPSWLLKLKASFSSMLKASSDRVREVRRELEPRSDQLQQDLNRFLGDYRSKLRKAGKQGLVVVVDDLEKLPAPGERGENAGPDPRVALFVDGATKLKAPACAVIYTVPVSLLYDHALGDIYGQDPHLLPMVKVQTRDRSPHPPGIAVMQGLLARRVNLDALFEPEAVIELIRGSGGHSRDLLRLMREACLTARDRQEARVSHDTAEAVVRNFANTNYVRLAWARADALREVARQRRLPAPHGVLAQQLLVMEYRNEAPWNDVHPCLLHLPELHEVVGDPG